MKFTKAAVVFLGLLLLLYVTNKSLSDIRARALETARPALQLTNKILHKINTPISSDSVAKDDKASLKTKIKILEARLAQMKEFSLENERLRALLSFRKQISYQTIPAQVIGRDPSSWTNLIYLDKGKKSGVEQGMGVTTDQGLVGKIIESSDSIAKAMLLNDPDSRIAAVVQRSRQEGLLCGTLSHKCRMIYISMDADVRIGDIVVTSGSGETFSTGLLIGKIVDLFEERGGLYRSAIIKPAADLERLEEVLCIK